MSIEKFILKGKFTIFYWLLVKANNEMFKIIIIFSFFFLFFFQFYFMNVVYKRQVLWYNGRYDKCRDIAKVKKKKNCYNFNLKSHWGWRFIKSIPTYLWNYFINSGTKENKFERSKQCYCKSNWSGLCVLILYMSGGIYSLKSTSNDRFLRNFFKAILYSVFFSTKKCALYLK